jgi:hypothetical protein
MLWRQPRHPQKQELRTPPEKDSVKIPAPLAGWSSGEASSATVDAGTHPGKDSKKIAAPAANQKLVWHPHWWSVPGRSLGDVARG